MASQQATGDGWTVQVVAYDELELAPNAAPNGSLSQTHIDNLLETLALFADGAGQRLNAMDVCPSELTVEGHVALDLGGGILLFGVSAGISVSMTWRFEETVTHPRDKRRTDPQPPDPPNS
jgi:hypothetical protein